MKRPGEDLVRVEVRRSFLERQRLASPPPALLPGEQLLYDLAAIAVYTWRRWITWLSRERVPDDRVSWSWRMELRRREYSDG